ncbi:MAG: hypothetical protein H0A76_13545 [Candidatus Thiodubiliella endoseptemdiera]|uniref:Uncharacterized protein n=1 Tax=Candidatus Thiodubiliella endoseptemdiera TaxID=2738886 RepID=A0A853F8F6_9GAMM|nr:hypothetical protein [Candidatus Thiodubiliella endoseptemdiera]
MATAAKFVQPIPIFLAYLVPLDVDVVPIKFHHLFTTTAKDCFCSSFNFFIIWPLPWQTQVALEKSTLDSTTSHGI